MNEISWDNNKLEPVIITYNRAELLGSTLSAFYNAGLSCIRLHVLDNASTDNTQQVVESFSDRWPELTYHSNKYNIGGNANILRAVELSSSEYSWVIGDDDEWHLNDISELISILETGTADIIRLGWLVSDNSRGKLISLKTLASEENNLFASLSMISATIARRSLLAKYLRDSYMNIAQFYPQLVPYIRSLDNEEVTVYSVNSNLMVHTPSQEPGYYLGDLEWYSHWFFTSRFINDSNYRRKFNNEIFFYKTGNNSAIAHFILLLKIALLAKAKGMKQGSYIATMVLVGRGHRIMLSLLLGIYLLSPYPLLKIIRDYFKYSKTPSLRDITRL